MVKSDLDEFNQAIAELAKQRDKARASAARWNFAAVFGWSLIAGFIFRELLR